MDGRTDGWMHKYTHARTQTTTDKTRRTVAAASLVAVSRFLEPPALGVVSNGRLEEDGSVEASLSTILSLSSHLDLLLLLRIRGMSFFGEPFAGVAGSLAASHAPRGPSTSLPQTSFPSSRPWWSTSWSRSTVTPWLLSSSSTCSLIIRVRVPRNI